MPHGASISCLTRRHLFVLVEGQVGRRPSLGVHAHQLVAGHVVVGRLGVDVPGDADVAGAVDVGLHVAVGVLHHGLPLHAVGAVLAVALDLDGVEGDNLIGAAVVVDHAIIACQLTSTCMQATSRAPVWLHLRIVVAWPHLLKDNVGDDELLAVLASHDLCAALARVGVGLGQGV